MPPKLITATEKFHLDTAYHSDSESGLKVTGVIETIQEIPAWFLDKLKAKRELQDSKSFSQLTKGDDLEKIHVARIPVAVINRWSREGFDFNEALSQGHEGLRKIQERLRLEDLSAFELTERTF